MKSIDNLSKFAMEKSEEKGVAGGYNPLGPITFVFEPVQGGETGGTFHWYLAGTHYASTHILPEHNWVYTSSYL